MQAYFLSAHIVNLFITLKAKRACKKYETHCSQYITKHKLPLDCHLLRKKYQETGQAGAAWLACLFQQTSLQHSTQTSCCFLSAVSEYFKLVSWPSIKYCHFNIGEFCFCLFCVSHPQSMLVSWILSHSLTKLLRRTFFNLLLTLDWSNIKMYGQL